MMRLHSFSSTNDYKTSSRKYNEDCDSLATQQLRPQKKKSRDFEHVHISNKFSSHQQHKNQCSSSSSSSSFRRYYYKNASNTIQSIQKSSFISSENMNPNLRNQQQQNIDRFVRDNKEIDQEKAQIMLRTNSRRQPKHSAQSSLSLSSQSSSSASSDNEEFDNGFNSHQSPLNVYKFNKGQFKKILCEATFFNTTNSLSKSSFVKNAVKSQYHHDDNDDNISISENNAGRMKRNNQNNKYCIPKHSSMQLSSPYAHSPHAGFWDSSSVLKRANKLSNLEEIYIPSGKHKEYSGSDDDNDGESNNRKLRSQSYDVINGGVMNSFFKSKQSLTSNMFNNGPSTKKSLQSAMRKININPYSILDAPFIGEENIRPIDVNHHNGQIAVGLKNKVYLLDKNGQNSLICEYDESQADYRITHVKWLQTNDLLISINTGQIDIWSVAKKKLLRRIQAMESAILTLDVYLNFVAVGGDDEYVRVFDLRKKAALVFLFHSNFVNVTSLKFSERGLYLGGGSADGKIKIWKTGPLLNIASSDMTPTPIEQLNKDLPHIAHFSVPCQSEISDICWCPWDQNLICIVSKQPSGSIRIFDLSKMKKIVSIDTELDITCIKFSQSTKELITSHGAPYNQITLWNFTSTQLKVVAELYAHTDEIVQTQINKEGDSIVSISLDETLRYWKIFPQIKDHLQNKSKMGENMDGKDNVYKLNGFNHSLTLKLR